MKPYYQDKWVTIYNADCREILPQLEPVDLVLTDPPYGNNMQYGAYNDTKDSLKNLVGGVFEIMRSKSKRMLVTCGVGNIYLWPEPDWVLLWVSTAGVGSGKWGFCCWQPILAYGSDPFLANAQGRRPDLIMSNKSSGKYEHPCPKPVNLWLQLMARGSASTDDLILDPFLGSGTTCYCAKKLNRKSIGIEIEEKYCEIAAKRCSQEVMELNI